MDAQHSDDKGKGLMVVDPPTQSDPLTEEKRKDAFLQLYKSVDVALVSYQQCTACNNTVADTVCLSNEDLVKVVDSVKKADKRKEARAKRNVTVVRTIRSISSHSAKFQRPKKKISKTSKKGSKSSSSSSAYTNKRMSTTTYRVKPFSKLLAAQRKQKIFLSFSDSSSSHESKNSKETSENFPLPNLNLSPTTDAANKVKNRKHKKS